MFRAPETRPNSLEHPLDEVQLLLQSGVETSAEVLSQPTRCSGVLLLLLQGKFKTRSLSSVHSAHEQRQAELPHVSVHTWRRLQASGHL